MKRQILILLAALMLVFQGMACAGAETLPVAVLTNNDVAELKDASTVQEVLEGLLGFLVSRIRVNFNPKRRKAADILKGVETDGYPDA